MGGALSGFHRLTARERLEKIQVLCQLNDEDARILAGQNSLPLETAEHLIENVIGVFSLPLGVATHFIIDGKEVLIPMVVEETSIIAAASAMAKWIARDGEIRTRAEGHLIIGQIQLPSVSKVAQARRLLEESRATLITLANESVPGLVNRGGGVQDLVVREVERATGDGTMLVLHVLCDPCDAMGANLINQICETLKPHIEKITGERVGLCILSNLVDGKRVIAEVTLRNVDPVLGAGIQEAAIFAKSDPYRATTHNKGVMNGIDPILVATGNDWRAAEAGVHAYAARSGRYQPVTDWTYEAGVLRGRIDIPLALGTVGGVTRLHPTARVALKMMKVEHAEDLARICAAVGLVENLGSLKALSTEGIVRGHMKLHTANLAIAAGADASELDEVCDRLGQVLKDEKNITLTKAKEILEKVRDDRRK